MRMRLLLAALWSLGPAAVGCGADAKPPYVLNVPDGGGEDAGSQEVRPGDAPHGEPGDDPDEPADGGPWALADGPSDGGQAGDGARDAGGAAGEPAPPTRGCLNGPTLRILFIGNSHTFTNDLPSTVQKLACEAGTQVITQSATPGGVGFIEHATDPNTQAAIDAEDWDVVIMQDQQQRPGLRLEEIEADHLPSLLSLVDAIHTHRAETRTLMYMVWARVEGDTPNCDYYPLACSFETSTHAIEQGYRFYAERTASLIAPVALAWAAVRADADSPIPAAQLWNADGYHPMPPGTYLAAAVLVGTLLELETSPLAFEAGLPPAVAEYLRGVADRIVREERSDQHVTTAERVRIDCGYGEDCSDAADAKPVSFTLSSDDCEALMAGDGEPSARIDTTLDCRGSCTTVALGDWHRLDGDAIEDGAYQLHAHVDVDDDGELSPGDLEACESGFEIGSGDDLVLTELLAR